jgi:hypothetical protein
MNLDVHFYFHADPEVSVLLKTILRKVNTMSAELDRLTAEVAETNTVIGSAIVLIQGLKAALDAAIASGDPAALTALSDSLDSQQQALAAAVAANPV